jgi:hypothetical protein
LTAEKEPQGLRLQSSRLTGIVEGLEGIDESQLRQLARDTEDPQWTSLRRSASSRDERELAGGSEVCVYLLSRAACRSTTPMSVADAYPVHSPYPTSHNRSSSSERVPRTRTWPLWTTPNGVRWARYGRKPVHQITASISLTFRLATRRRFPSSDRTAVAQPAHHVIVPQAPVEP